MSTPTISAEMVNNLRLSTGAGLMDCKKALLESNGNMEEAVSILRKKGIASASKKAGREATEGLIESYIHLGGKVGVLLEVNCETDFVAKNDEFRRFVKDVCMHIAAASPSYLKREEVPQDLLNKEIEVAKAQCEGKPAPAVEKIVQGKLDKWYAQICLMEQPFVKSQDQKISDVVVQMIAKLGENIVIRRFVRYQIGE